MTMNASLAAKTWSQVLSTCSGKKWICNFIKLVSAFYKSRIKFHVKQKPVSLPYTHRADPRRLWMPEMHRSSRWGTRSRSARSSSSRSESPNQKSGKLVKRIFREFKLLFRVETKSYQLKHIPSRVGFEMKSKFCMPRGWCVAQSNIKVDSYC